MILFILIFLPFLLGLSLFLLSRAPRLWQFILLLSIQSLSLAGTIFCFFRPQSITIWNISSILSLSYETDKLGGFISILICVMAIPVSIFSIKHRCNKNHLLLSFLSLTQGALLSMCFSDNLFTLFVSGELLSFCTLTLFFQNKSSDTPKSWFVFFIHTLAGAALVAAGMILLITAGNTNLTFDTFNSTTNFVQNPKSLWGISLICLGFCAKSGLFPLHCWLPALTPWLPVSAGAFFSAVFTKVGFLGITRTLYYLIPLDAIKSSRIHSILIWMSIFTILWGSFVACTTESLPKRLAYSTISQMGSVLLGTFLLSEAGLRSAFLYMTFHTPACICLYLSAGYFISKSGRTQIRQLHGIGATMPVSLLCFSFASLSMIGIPPTGGFEAIWNLCLATIDCQEIPFSGLIPVLLLLNSLLTAKYLLPLVTNGFFPGKNTPFSRETFVESKTLWIPMLIFVLFIFGFGMFSDFLQNIIGGILGDPATETVAFLSYGGMMQ